MIKYFYYLCIVLNLVPLISYTIYFIKKPTSPVGPDSADWALNLFVFVIWIATVVLGIALFNYSFWRAGLSVIILPITINGLFFLKGQNLDPKTVFLKVPSLIITITNTTNYKIHVKIDCITRIRANGQSFQSIDYRLPANQKKNFALNKYEIGLIAKKAKKVKISVYNESTLNSWDAPKLIKEYTDRPESFRVGTYQIIAK
jgi:hypothetical protein